MSRELAEYTIEVCHEILSEGIKSYWPEAARRLGLSIPSIRNRLRSAEANHGLTVDESHFRPKRTAAAFAVDPLPDDGEPAQPHQRAQPKHADFGLTCGELRIEVLRHAVTGHAPLH
jgi:hypothetical protein